MKRILYTMVQITWGFPQTIIGAFLFIFYARCPHFSYHGAIATVWPARSSVSLGLFVFVSKDPRRCMISANQEFDIDERLLVHEYGHTIQSLLFGPTYLIVFGIPSFLWATMPALRQRRIRRNTSYYSLYTERLANYFGERVTKHPAIRR